MTHCNRLSVIPFLVVAPLLGACGGALDDPSGRTDSRDADNLFVQSSQVWPSNTLSVCFEDTGFDDEKAWTADALQKSWEAETALDFVFVGQCSDAKANLHVHFQDARGVTNYLGKSGDGQSNNVNLNTWASGTCVGGWSRERCVRSTAVHEFGHAIGFTHEQRRDDTPASCTAEKQGPKGDQTVGDWDEGSVMNYCNPVRNGDARLSATDIWGAGRYYGARKPVALVSHDGSMEAFYRGQDNQVWHLWGNGGDWSGHEGLGNDLSSAPAAVSWGDGRMDIFARVGTDGHLEHMTWVPSGWAGWESLDRDGMLGGPVAVTRGGKAVDVFVRTNAGLSHRAADESGWGGWNDLGTPAGVQIVGDPAAVAWGADALEVFVRGTDSALWHAWWRADSGWSGWGSLGGIITSAPSVISSAPGSLEVFARGNDDSIAHIWYNGSWSDWDTLGGLNRGGPTVLSIGEGQMNLVVRGTDQEYHLRFDNGWSDWEGIAGRIRGSVALATDGSRLGMAAMSSSRNGELLYNDDLDVGPVPTGLGSAIGRAKSGWRSLGGQIQ